MNWETIFTILFYNTLLVWICGYVYSNGKSIDRITTQAVDDFFRLSDDYLKLSFKINDSNTELVALRIRHVEMCVMIAKLNNRIVDLESKEVTK